MPAEKSKYEVLIHLLNLVLGTLLVLAPWTFGFASDARFQAVGVSAANAWITGLLIFAAATLAIVEFAEWHEWTSALAGLWASASPWILGFEEDFYARGVSVLGDLAVVSVACLELNLVEQRSQLRADIERELSHVEGRLGPTAFGPTGAIKARADPIDGQKVVELFRSYLKHRAVSS